VKGKEKRKERGRVKGKGVRGRWGEIKGEKKRGKRERRPWRAERAISSSVHEIRAVLD